MTSLTLNDKLKDFDFSAGDNYTFSYTYNIREEDGLALLDQDSADAAASVDELGLSYDINARHYSTVIDGDHITDMVSVTWEFWKNG